MLSRISTVEFPDLTYTAELCYWALFSLYHSVIGRQKKVTDKYY